MSKTVLFPVRNFDADLPVTFKFDYFGKQINKNKLVIRDNQTNKVVYSKEYVSMRAEHILKPENSGLLNGVTYNAQISVLCDGETAYEALSNQIVFQCFATPVVEFIDFPENSIVQNSSVIFSAKYSQAQNDLLNSYNFILYNAGNEEIWSSGSKYTEAISTPYTISQIVQNLENNRQYYVQCTVESVHGMVATTKKLGFTVSYIMPEQFSIISAENIPEMCSIKVATNVIMIDGKGSSSAMKYINDNEIDLSNTKDYVVYDENFDINNDFELTMKVRYLRPYRTLCTLSDGANSVILKLMKGLLFGETKEKYYFVLRASNGFTNYTTISGLIDIISTSHSYIVDIQRRNNFYQIRAKKI